MKFVSRSEAGVKGFNQDALAVPPEGINTEEMGYCLAVSDGITLCPKGGELAEHAIKIVEFYYELTKESGAGEKTLDRALDKLWDSFFKSAQDGNERDYLSSGATLTIALILNGKIYLRHLGDSTCDIFLPDGSAQRITDEHSTADGCLVNYFGGEIQSKPQTETRDFPKGSKVILSSDGISYFLENDFIKKLAEELAWKAEEMVSAMFALSAQAGSVDDRTLVIGH